MTRTGRVWLICVLVAVPVIAAAQFPEDALRLGSPGSGVGARTLGMGNASIGVASDFSAIASNPAGLAQLRFGEFALGMNYLSLSDEATFLGNVSSYSSGSTTLNMLGVVIPVPVRQGSFVLAFGFHRQNDFTAGASFSGFNPSASYIQTWAPDGQPYGSDLSGNLAYQLYLADIDTVTGRWISPIRDRVGQSATVLEGGGLDNWSAAGAAEVAKNAYLGATVTYVSGSYSYDRVYQESDDQGLYQTFPYDFSRLRIDDRITADVSGWYGRFGFLYNVMDFLRFGVSIKTPTGYHVREDFTTEGRSFFDNGDVQLPDGPFQLPGRGEYDVTTPWVFGAGTSLTLGPVLLAADGEFTDWSTMKFSDAVPDVEALNRDIREIFRPAVNLRLGAELRLGFLHPRAGLIYNMSPYREDESSPADFFTRTFDQKYATVGTGLLLSGSVMLDVAYAYGWWKTYRINDLGTSRTDESIDTHTVSFALRVRF
jgi:long-subunit fatty acid transport protein